VVLLVEGLSTGVRVTARLPVLPAYPWLTILLTVLRVAVALQQFTAGWMVLGDRPPGARLARWAYAESTMLLSLELGFRLAPSNIFPAYRWWFVGLYAMYSVIGLIAFRHPRD
jgi:hypothetical protein